MEMEKTLETQYGNFLLRPYRFEDEDNVIRLWELAFKQKIDKRIWRWKFHDNPFGRQMMICFNEKNEAIAMYSGIPFPANLNGEYIRMTQLIDNMSHPDYRQAVSGRKGLFVRTSEHFFDLYGGKHSSVYHYGFPGIKHFKLGKLLMKYGKVSEGGTYMEAKPGRQKSKLRFSLEKVNQTSDFDKRFDKLWERGKNLYPFAIRRNSEFLNWRFTKHPKNSYKIFKVSDYGKNLKAYVVILKEKNLAKIIDVFSDGNKKSLQRLMQYILNDMYDDETQKIVVWLPKEHFITQTFADSGFCFQKEPLGIVPTGRSFDENLSFDFTAKNIFYTMADGDLF